MNELQHIITSILGYQKLKVNKHDINTFMINKKHKKRH